MDSTTDGTAIGLVHGGHRLTLYPMKIGELNRVNESRQEKKYQRVLDEVNRIYMANRDEFETTTVCGQDGVVRYVRGVKPRSEIPFVPAEVPAWKVRQTEAWIRSYERAYKC